MATLYMQHVLRILSLDETVYRQIVTRDKLSLWYTAFNVAAFGLIYGLSALYFSRFLLTESGEAVTLTLQLKVTVILMGISVAFLIHGGAALFAWVFCRGFGGSPYFLPIYLVTGVAWISLWPLAPLLAMLQTGAGGGSLIIWLAAGVLYGLMVFFHALKSASGLSTPRMIVVMFVVIIYICSFMYLWVG